MRKHGILVSTQQPSDKLDKVDGELSNEAEPWAEAEGLTLKSVRINRRAWFDKKKKIFRVGSGAVHNKEELYDLGRWIHTNFYMCQVNKFRKDTYKIEKVYKGRFHVQLRRFKDMWCTQIWLIT